MFLTSTAPATTRAVTADTSRRKHGHPHHYRRRRHRHKAAEAMKISSGPAAAAAAAPRKAGTRSNTTFVSRALLFVVAVLLVGSSGPPTVCAEGSWPLVEDEPQNLSNNLGVLTEACARSFCGVGVNALDLWWSLEQVCVTILCAYDILPIMIC